MIMLVLLSTVLLAISLLSAVCLLKRRRLLPCFSKHRMMEPNVLYTAAADSVPFDPAAAAAGNHNCTNTITTTTLHTHTHTTVLLLFWNMSGTTRVSR